MKKTLFSLVFLFALAGSVVYFSDSCRAEIADRPLHVWVVSPEGGFFKTGGLGPATDGLAKALNKAGVWTDFIMPYYMEADTPKTVPVANEIKVPLDFINGVPHKTSRFSVHSTVDYLPHTFLLRHENDANQQNYFDNRRQGIMPKFYGPENIIGEAMGAFARAAANFILSRADQIDVVILNDWTTGLIAYHLEQARERGLKVPIVWFAIHNIAYQGQFPHSLVDFLGIPETFSTDKGIEFWGKMNMLKAGIQYSDKVYTVSNNYAEEIATSRFGAGLEGLIQRKRLEGRMMGIPNGIDREEWDPTVKKPGLEWTFSSGDLTGKSAGKAALQEELGLSADGDAPLFILTSRLVEQKGFNYVIDAIAQAAASHSHWLIIGDGDPNYIRQLQELEQRYPDKVRYRPFSAALEARATRYADYFLNAAWFEPCGLNQLFALLNGTIPVVSRVGGLADSVQHGETGILFDIIPQEGTGAMYDKEATIHSLVNAIHSALELYNDKAALQKMRMAGMGVDNSWLERVQNKFLPLFKSLVKKLQQDPLSVQGLNASPCMQALAPGG